MRDAEGKSINAYNPATKAWQQYWAGQGGIVTEFRESAWHDGAITFTARYPATPTAGAYLARLTFTPINDSTVRQTGEQSVDEGKTWTTTYDLLYHRKRAGVDDFSELPALPTFARVAAELGSVAPRFAARLHPVR